jgi:drug/metabolite transporter (DMT)-like permease
VPARPGQPAEHHPDPTARRLAEIGVLLVVLCWAANFVVVKAVLADMPPLVFTAMRYVVAAISVLALLYWRERTIRIGLRDAAIVMALGVLGFGAYQVLWTVGLTQTTAGDSALIIATTPVLVTLIAAAIGTDTLTVPKLIGALVSFAGVPLVIGVGQDVSAATTLLGAVLTFGGAVVWAFYSALGARVLRRIDPLRVTAWAVTGGMLSLVPLGLWQAADTGFTPAGIQLGHIGAILYSGILAAGLSNVLVMRGIKVIGPTRVTVLQYGVSPLAVILGALFLAEPIRPAQIVGGVIIVLGVIVARMSSESLRLGFRFRAG